MILGVHGPGGCMVLGVHGPGRVHGPGGCMVPAGGIPACTEAYSTL